MNTKYWINSNTGDIIFEKDGKYRLILIARYQGDKYLQQEIVKLTVSQFLSIKGFIPIKRKKIRSINFRKYTKTLKGGVKENSSNRVDIPSISDSRGHILEKIGI
jgi:hypothetical protein